MKKNISNRVLSVLLAIVMIFLMMPYTKIDLTADTITLVEYDEFEHLGAGYNLLGDRQLSSSTVTSKSAIFNDNFTDYLHAEKRTGSESTYTYTYITDMNSYLHKQSSSLQCDIGVGAKIKLFSIDAKTKMGIEVKASAEGNTQYEYAVLKANQKISYRYVNLESHLSDMWKNDALSSAFLEDIRNLDDTNIDLFVEKYGTHIIVGYSSGGGAVTSYRNESFSYTGTLFVDVNTEVGVSAGLAGLVSAEERITGKDSLDITIKEQGEKAKAHGYSYGADGLIEWDSEGGNFGSVNDFFEMINEKNSQILVDSDLKLIPVWALVLACNNVSDISEIKAKGQLLKEYVNDQLEKQCSDFYMEYLGEEYISDDPSETVDEWLSQENLIIITNAEDFNKIRNNLRGTYVLACDIDLSDYKDWTPIGTRETPFLGKLYGNYNTVKGLSISSSDETYVGLFGYNEGIIKNLKVDGTINGVASSDVFFGGIAAYNVGLIENCYDSVTYNIDYTSIDDLNIPLEDINLDSITENTITIGNCLGVKLTGTAGKEYSGINIVIEDKGIDSPAYIVLNNANITGDSINGTLYNPTNRPIYIISVGESNTIKGVSGKPGYEAINSKDADLHLFGTAPLSIYGGNGNNGSNGSGANHYGGNGKDGYCGAPAINAANVFISANALNVYGGTGGRGGNGGIGWWTGTNVGRGGKGGKGGDGAAAIIACQVKYISGSVLISAGNGGKGGSGGDGENIVWSGGYGGNGGNGGDSFDAVIGDLLIPSYVDSKLVLRGGIAGKGGSGGYGQERGYANSGSAGVSATYVSELYSESKHYSLCENKKNWNDAKTHAESLNGYLATITDSTEFDLIAELISFGTLQDYYIGAYRIYNDTNSWAWVTGEEFDYSIWNSGEPNNSGGKENYLGIAIGDGGYFNDFPDGARAYIIEYDREESIGVEEDNIVSGIITGYTSNTIYKISDSSWNEITLTVDSFEKTTEIFFGEGDARYSIGMPVYYSGDKHDIVSDFKVSFCDSEISGYNYVFNTFCEDDVLRRNGFIKISREGVERYIPVKIIKPVPVSIRIAETGKTEFIVNSAFDINGLIVEVTYDNGDTEYLTENSINISYTTPKLSNLNGTEKVTVYYDHDLNSATESISDSYLINIVDDEVVSLRIEEKPTVKYFQGEDIIVEGHKVVAVYASGKEIYLSDNRLRISVSPSLCYAGESTITVMDAWSKEFSTYTVTVSPVENYDHDWNEGVVTKMPTHTTEGIKTYKCSKCDETKTEQIEKLSGHVFGEWYKLNETQHQRMCECGETVELDHVWNEGQISTIPTHTTYGESIYTCIVCGATDKRIVEKTNEHSYSDWIEIDSLNHSRSCVCGDTEIEVHNWNNGIITSDPTYTTTGSIKYTCISCSATITEEIPALEVPATAPHIIVDSKNAVVGDTLTVKISLKNNPGITSMRINVQYDNAVLKLTEIKYNSAMGGQSVLPESIDSLNGNVILYWADGFSDYIGDAVFATLTFRISENAVENSTSSIAITYDAEDIYNADENNVTFFCDNGEITFINYIPGDISGDGVVNTKDTTRLMRYLAGWTVEVNERALDVNGDGVVNTKDTTRLMRYLAGWDVEIN